MTGSGDVTGAVEEYRALLGTDNEAAAAQDSGRREITWDGVPDDLASPNDLPPDFFRGRGARWRRRATRCAMFPAT